MKSVHFDPNNHVPEVAPDDSWGDFGSDTSAPQLPPRRTLAEKIGVPAAGISQKNQPGLHIESVLPRNESGVAQPRLEVQEIGGSGIKRLDQALPKPEKIAHQGTFKEKPKHDPSKQDKSGEGRDWGHQKRHSTRYFLIMGGSVIAFIVLAMVLLPLINSLNAPTGDNSKNKLVAVEEEVITGVDAMNFLANKQNEATEIFRAYAQASDVEAVIPLMRNGAASRDLLRGHWHPLNLPNSWTPDASTTWSVPDSTDRAYGLLEGVFPDQSPFSAYFIQNGTRLSLDWKATVAFSTATFTELQAGSGDTREIRGSLSAADYYDTAWPENDYTSYRFTAPSGGASVWCYARRGESADHALALLFRKGEIVQDEQTTQKLTLRLARGPNPGQPNQWLIQEMLQSGWLTLSTHP